MRLGVVRGNVLRLSLALETETVSCTAGRPGRHVEPFYPEGEVVVALLAGSRRVRLTSSVNGNVVSAEDLGTLPRGVYALEVRCVDGEGNPYRWEQAAAVQVVETPAEAYLLPGVEFDCSTHRLKCQVTTQSPSQSQVTGRVVVDVESGDNEDFTVTYSDGTTKPLEVPQYDDSTISGTIAELVGTVSELSQTVDGKQDVIDDLEDIRENAANAYQLPDGGIPAEDLADGVIPDTSGYVQTGSLAEVATSGDYGDLNNKPTIPAALADLSEDSGHRTVTDDEKTAWGGKQAALEFDSTPTTNSDHPVTSGGVYNALANKANIFNMSTVTTSGNVVLELQPGMFYQIVTPVDSLALTLVAARNGMAIYAGKFTTSANWGGNGLSIPSSVREGTNNPEIEAGKTYEFNIMDNVLLFMEV